MEAACESARHAVNAILDHYVWVESGGVDRREKTTLNWRFPFGFLDQGFSSPIRMPTPAGDYCYVFDIENREPSETRNLRNLDSQYCLASPAPPLGLFGCQPDGRPAFPVPSIPGGQPMTSPSTDHAQQLLAHLQAWRQHLEQTVGATTPSQQCSRPRGGCPPRRRRHAAADAGRGSTPISTPPTDYTQQLLAYLQAWRQYLEQTTRAAAACPPPPPLVAQPPDAPPSDAPSSDAPPPDAPPPGAVSLLASSPRPATSGSTPPATEYVVPEHGWMSHFAFYKEPTHPEGESFPGSGSLYQPSRSLLPSSPVGEYQPNSAYVSAHSATSGRWVSGAAQSLYSSPAPPAARSRRRKRCRTGPKQLEIVKPSIELTK